MTQSSSNPRAAAPWLFRVLGKLASRGSRSGANRPHRRRSGAAGPADLLRDRALRLSNALILSRTARGRLPSPLLACGGRLVGRKRAMIGLSPAVRAYGAAARAAAPIRRSGAPVAALDADPPSTCRSCGLDLRRPRADRDSGWFRVLFRGKLGHGRPLPAASSRSAERAQHQSCGSCSAGLVREVLQNELTPERNVRRWAACCVRISVGIRTA